MRPTLLSLRIGGGEIGVHAYGLFVGLGFAIAIGRLWREGRRRGFDGGRLLDFAFWSLVAGVVGSRAAFVAVNARAFLDACFEPSATGAIAATSRFSGCLAPLRFWQGGLVFYGGAVAAGAVAVWFCRRERWSFGRFADLAAPSLAIGHALGRIGCLFAGCCFGAACGAPWALTFPQGSVAFDELHATGAIAAGAERTMSLHPTQLYEAVGELAIFALLVALEARWRRSGRPGETGAETRLSASAAASADANARVGQPGRTFLVYVAAYATLRFVVEIFRGDTARGHVLVWTAPRIAAALGVPAEQPLLLSVSQLASLIALAMVAVALCLPKRIKPNLRA
jgi:phosphatidylglycerol:prolipoprotein diacylglycerol transferase